jgi:hypothetical protein
MNPPVDSTCLASTVWKALGDPFFSIEGLPIQSKEMWVLSDYGGSHSTSAVDTYSFLICDVKDTGPFRLQVERFRRGIGMKCGEMAFSKIRNAFGYRALSEFVECALVLNAQIITVAIDKHPSLHRLYWEVAGPETQDLPVAQAIRAFQPAVLDRVWRVTHLVAALIAAFSQPDWAAFWVTDEDDIAASDAHGRALTTLLAHVLPRYTGSRFPSGEVHTTESLGQFPIIGELASIPDLCAGAVAELLSLDVRGESRLENVTTQFMANSSARTSKLLPSLVKGNTNLKHAILRVVPGEDQLFSILPIRFL